MMSCMINVQTTRVARRLMPLDKAEGGCVPPPTLSAEERAACLADNGFSAPEFTAWLRKTGAVKDG
jgi:hypothetical protein